MRTPCAECGYDLSNTTATDGDTRLCPECGTPNTAGAIAVARANELETRVRRKDWPCLPLDVALLFVSYAVFSQFDAPLSVRWWLPLVGPLVLTPWWWLRAVWLVRERRRTVGEQAANASRFSGAAWIALRAWMLSLFISLLGVLLFSLLP